MRTDVQVYTCGQAAKWLPRVLAGAVLGSALLGSYRVDTQHGIAFAPHMQLFLAMVGAIAAWWIVRGGAEVRIAVEVAADRLILGHGKRKAEVVYETIERFDFNWPMGSSRLWLPAMVVLDDQGRGWRVPALLSRGEQLVEDLLARSGRDDLRTWSEALQLQRQMSRSVQWVRAGYGLALAILVVGIAFYLR